MLSKESQESSPSPQFKSINSLVPLSDLYRDYWKNHSFDCQFSSVTQSCLTLSNPMDCSTPGFPVHHQLPEPIQTHVHCIGGAIQPSHPLLSSSRPAFNLSQDQGLTDFQLRSSANSFSHWKHLHVLHRLNCRHLRTSSSTKA